MKMHLAGKSTMKKPCIPTAGVETHLVNQLGKVQQVGRKAEEPHEAQGIFPRDSAPTRWENSRKDEEQTLSQGLNPSSNSAWQENRQKAFSQESNPSGCCPGTVKRRDDCKWRTEMGTTLAKE